MQTPGKTLQLILFTVEDKKSRTLLEDSLSFQPNYQIGDVIHLLRPESLGTQPDVDHQYVVRQTKHIITGAQAGYDHCTYIVLVEVAELVASQQEKLDRQSHYLTRNGT
ncbi:hypothetical protein GCM10028819_14180 [Spirosoma humi]